LSFGIAVHQKRDENVQQNYLHQEGPQLKKAFSQTHQNTVHQNQFVTTQEK
jgi:hypothetical protein